VNSNYAGIATSNGDRDEKRAQSYVLSEKPLFLSRAARGHTHSQSDGPFAARRRGYEEAVQETLFAPRTTIAGEASEAARSRSKSPQSRTQARRARTRPPPTPESLKAAYEKVVLEEIKQWESSVGISSGDDRSDGSPSPMARVPKSDWISDQQRLDNLLHKNKPVQLRGWGSKARATPKWLTRSMTSPNENVTSDSNSTTPSSPGDFDFTAGSVQSSPRLQVSKPYLPKIPAPRSRGIPAPGPREVIPPPSDTHDEPEPRKPRPFSAPFTKNSPHILDFPSKVEEKAATAVASRTLKEESKPQHHILDFPARKLEPALMPEDLKEETKSPPPHILDFPAKDGESSPPRHKLTTYEPRLVPALQPTEDEHQDSKDARTRGFEAYKSRPHPAAAFKLQVPSDSGQPSTTPLRLTSDYIEQALKPSPPEIAARTLNTLSRLRQEHTTRLERSQLEHSELASPIEEDVSFSAEGSPSVRPKHHLSPLQRNPVERGRQPSKSSAKSELPHPVIPSHKCRTNLDSREETQPKTGSSEVAPSVSLEGPPNPSLPDLSSEAISPARDDTFVLLRRLGSALSTKRGSQPTARADLEAIKSEVEGETTATDISIMEGRLGRGLASIIEAKAGIEDLEDRVAAAARYEYQPPNIVYVSLPLPLLWRKTAPPVNNWRGGRQFTWLGLFLTLFVIWYLSEDAACAAYCKPEYLGHGEPLNPNAPFFGGALWYAMKEGAGVILQWWAE
jgi:hypothetical protein